MSYLRTKPRWCTTAVATDAGWVNSLNGELLVSYKGLKSKIDAELASQSEVVMQEEVKVKVAPVQVKVKEEAVKKPKKNQKILGEVVEFDVADDAKVIGE